MKVVIVLALVASGVSHAQYLTGTIAAGAGGAGRACVDPLEGALLNPATLPQLQQYYMGAYWSESSEFNQGQQRDTSFVVADSTPDKVMAGAFAYTQRKIAPPGQDFVNQRDYTIALADFMTERSSVGISAHHLKSEFGQGTNFDQTNFHVGFLWTPTKSFGLAVVGYDWLRPSSDTPNQIQLLPTASFGLVYVLYDLFRFRFDLNHPLRANAQSRNVYMSGFESVLNQYLTLRIGGKWDDVTHQTLATAGFSYTGPRLGLDYAWQQETNPSGGQRHLVDLVLPF